MPIRSVDDIRKAWGDQWASASDEELLDAYSKAAKLPIGQVADKLNWGGEGRGMWGNRGSAAVDSYQANLYGIGEALGSDWAKRKRIENEVQANVARDWAQQQGAISSYKDVDWLSPSSVGNYAGGLAVDSAPYLGEVVLGGITGGATLPGTVARMGLGTLSRGVARTAGAVGASYPSSVGDILANQREQTGTTNLGSALLGGIPYAAANAFGVTGALARGAAMKSGIRALDELTGLRGVAARTGASVGKGVLTEAPAETFQEGVNQYFGRMAVDPNETFFNERSNDRFMESAVGGGVLGGLFGGGMGGWRRSNEWYAKQAEDARRTAGAQPQTDLLQGERPRNLLDGADSNDLIGGEYSPLSNPPMYGQTADGRSVTSTLTPETTDPKELVARHADIDRFLGSIEQKLQELQPQYEAAVASGDRAAQARIQNLRSELQKSGFAANDEYNQLDPLVQRYLAENYEPGGLFGPRYASTSGRPSNLINGGISFADAESINVPTQFRPEFVDQSLGLRFPQPGAAKSRMSDVQAALSEPTNMFAVSQPDQHEQRLDAGQVAALRAGQLEDDANKQAEAKYAAKRTAATDALVDKEPDGTQPVKIKPREIETHGTLAALKEAGTITPEVYSDLVGRVRDALKANDTKTLNAVAKEVKALAAPAPAPVAAETPAKPASPNVVINAAGPANQGVVTRSAAPDTKPSAPAAPINEPTNQLLQGTPDVSVAAVAGERTGGSSVGQRADTGTGVADAGRNTAAAVGVPAPAGGVEPVGSQAGTVPDAAASGAAAPVSEAAPDVVVGTGNPDVAVKTKKTRKAALGTDERRADILARIQEAKASGSKLSGVKGKQGGGIDVELLALYAELAADHVVKTGRNFAEFTRRMVSDLGEDVKPYLRQLHTEAQAVIRKDVKAVAVERTPDGAPVMLESKNANGEVVGYTVKLKGKAGAYIRRDAESGQLVLVPERSGLTKQDAPVYLGDTLEEALDELPVAYGLLKTGRKIKEASGKTAVEFEPKNKAVVGGSIDFDLLHKATEGKPQYLKSIYLYLGIDKDGTRLTGKPMSANAAAREGGWGKNSGQNLTKAMNALGISDEVQTRFMQSDQLAPPLPGEALPMSVRERLNAAVEQDEESLGPYVNDLADTRNEDERGVEEAARGAGAFDDEANIDNEDSDDGSVLERFNEGISTISSAGGSSVGTEKTLNTSISSVKRFKALAEAIKRKLPLDSFPTVELLAGFHKVTKHVLPDILEGSESQTVTDNAYANEEFMVGVMSELEARERRAYGSPSAQNELRKARAAIVQELENEGTLIRDDKKGRSKTTAERDEEFVAGLTRDDKGNFDEANSTQADADQASAAESLFDSGREEDEEAGRAIDEQLGNADTAEDRRDNEDQVSGDTRYRTTASTPPSKAISRGALDQIVRSVGRFLAGRVKVTVMDDVTAYDPTQTPGSRAGVLTPKGEIILFRSGIADGVAGMKTVFHELLHKGLRALYSPGEYRQVMNYLYQSDARIRAAADEWLASPENQRDIQGRPEIERRALAVDEVLAEFAETTQPTVLRALGNWLARIAAKMGMPELAQSIRTMGLSDLQAFVSDALTAATRVRGDIEAETRARPGTSAFQRWFGGSKVVDKDGKPLVVYHGTNQDIDQFQMDGPLRNKVRVALTSLASKFNSEYSTRRAKEKATAFFTSSPALASDYANTWSSDQNVMSVYLSIKNPVVMDFAAGQMTLPSGRVIGLGNVTAAAIFSNEPLLNIARREGADGIIMRSVRDTTRDGAMREATDVYVAFDPTQIKSATGNNGNYDSTNPDIRYSTTDRSVRQGLQAFTNALPPSARNAQNDIVTVVRNAIMGTRNKLQFTHDLIDRATKLGLESAAKFGKLYRERAAMMNGLNGRVDDVARLYGSVPEKERGTGEGSANMLLKDSTMSDKWAFEPSWLPKGTATVDPQMKARFDALSPESQTYIKAVFEHGHRTLIDKKRIILNATTTEYDALIASAQAANNAAEVAELEKKKAATITKYDSLFKTKGNTPYAPLKRFGDWVVVAESKALKAARAANDEKLIAQLEQDGEHYYVDFFESNLEALRAERKLRESGLYDTGDEGVVTRKKSEERQRLFGGEGVAAAFTKLRTQVKKRADGSGDVARKALLEMATDMYLSALAETSARKSEMRRKGVAGDIDMLRSFTSQGYADAHMMSALAFSGVQGDEINAMEKEARKGGSAAQTAKTQVFNELVARHVGSMEYVAPNLLDQAKTAASIYYLAVSPAYYLQNLTQPWMVSLPVMAGRHGFSKSASMLWKAGSELADAWVGGGMGRALDLNKVPDDLRSMLKIMMDRGVLTSGQNREFENIKAAGQGRLMNAWTNSRDFIDGMQMKAEAMNRASTAAAAYRMELAKGTPEDKALEYVDRILRETHGDYSNLAAPRIFSSNFGKLALQFRKYQLLQLSLMGRLVRDIYQGNERAAAMQSLGFVLAQAGITAGAMGLPGFTAIAWLLTKMFGDPDEPDDPEYKLRKLIGDKDTADLILKGLPARMGLNLSNKIGWQNMLSILPYTDIDFTKKSVTEIGFALPFGAAGAMTAKVVDGIGAMRDGRYVEGLAKVMPKGFGDGVKAIDTAANGVRNKQGEVLLTPDEINFAEAAFMGIGLTPTEISSQQFRQGANIDFNKKLADRATKIKQQYVDAVRDGESTTDAREAWDKLQESRVENGFKKQPLQDLLKAVAESRKQERETMNGVQYRNTNRQFVENLGSI